MSSYRIPYLAVARFSGEDAGAFLQSQLTADVEALGDGQNTLACYCTPKGQVLGLLLVGRENGDFLLAGHATLLPGILKRLQMYVLRSKVRISDALDRCVTGSPGPEYGFSGGGVELPDPDAWRAAELRAGISWLNAGSTERFIPQMLGFEGIGAVSFTKGCYPGQEIVARARYLGRVKRGPLIVDARGLYEAPPGEKVRVRRGDQWSGAVVIDSAAYGTGGSVVFTVAATEPDLPPEELELGGQTYRCATT